MGVNPSHLPHSAPTRGGQTATRSLSGALSVASSMMDPPTICSIVPALQVGNLWGVKLTVIGSLHQTGMLYGQAAKLRTTELIHVSVDDQICFGLIGNRRFCRSRGCKVKAHTRSRFTMMGARGGWFLPAKPTLVGEPTTFIQPFLNVNKITQETEYHFKVMEKRSTADWKTWLHGV